MLFRIAFNYVKSKQDAEDIVQDVFLGLAKKPKIQGLEHLKAWLIRVTINKCKNVLKSHYRRKTISLNSDTIAFYNFDTTNIEVLDALGKLEPVDRDIVYLYYYEGYSTKEIAGFLDKKNRCNYY